MPQDKLLIIVKKMRNLISKKDIERLAYFARIRMDDEELKNAPKEIESILQYIQKLKDINTEKAEPLFHFPELTNIVREDKVEQTDKEIKEKMMKMGKDKDSYLKVESIL